MKRHINRKNKWIIFICITVILGLAATGCSNSSSSKSSDHANRANLEGGSTDARPMSASVPAIKAEELKVDSLDQGIQLYVRHKPSPAKKTFTEKEIVLFLEPYSVPSAEAFDVPGYSWMEEYANKGFDTWAMDFRGFGKSTRPDAMNKPPTENPQVVRAADAVKDLAAVVEYIKKTRNVKKINIVGWSWGAVVAGMYATEHSDSIENLVLYGAMHGFSLPQMASTYEAKDMPGVINPKMPSYQVITFEKGMTHWHMMMNNKELVSNEAYEAVHKVFTSSDETSSQREDQAIRRPMGPLVDLYYIWSNKPIFDASKIKAPVLVIRGDADIFADPTLIDKVTSAPKKKEVVIKDATHWVIYEKNRNQLLLETESFLKGF